MTNPVYVGMPPTDRTFDVPKAGKGIWGNIRCGGPCKDDYRRLVVRHHDGQSLTLQKAAMDSFADACEHLGFEILVTGSIRSCSDQTRYYNSDKSRYAPPSTSAHCRGLAIDVSMDQNQARLALIAQALGPRAWHQARPGDEPWHWAFGIQV